MNVTKPINSCWSCTAMHEIDRARQLLKTSGMASFDHHRSQDEVPVTVQP
jgi:hypothetical protein